MTFFISTSYYSLLLIHNLLQSLLRHPRLLTPYSFFVYPYIRALFTVVQTLCFFKHHIWIFVLLRDFPELLVAVTTTSSTADTNDFLITHFKN